MDTYQRMAGQWSKTHIHNVYHTCMHTLMGISKYDNDTLYVNHVQCKWILPSRVRNQVYVGLIKFILDSWHRFVGHFKDFAEYSKSVCI